MYLIVAHSPRAKRWVRRRKKPDFFTGEEIAGTMPNGLFLNETPHVVGRMLAASGRYGGGEADIYYVVPLTRIKLLETLQILMGWQPLPRASPSRSKSSGGALPHSSEHSPEQASPQG